MEPVEIPISKSKIMGNIALSVLFILTSLFIFLVSDSFDRFHPLLIKGAGILGFFFFGAACVAGVRKYFSSKSGLMINNDGITDRSHASSIGLIRWEDITNIRIGESASVKFLLIDVKNPNDYLARVKGVRRKLLKGNQNMFGTPLSITSNSLQIKFSDLEQLLRERFHEARLKTFDSL